MSEKNQSSDYEVNRTVEVGDVTSTESGGEYDENASKALVRKLDWHIMPVLVILYLLSFLDRSEPAFLQVSQRTQRLIS